MCFQLGIPILRNHDYGFVVWFNGHTVTADHDGTLVEIAFVTSRRDAGLEAALYSQAFVDQCDMLKAENKEG